VTYFNKKKFRLKLGLKAYFKATTVLFLYIIFIIQGGAVNCGQKYFCFQCLGPHVLVKLILGLKSTGWSVLGC
jgi:hypothetical protein